MSLIIIVAGKIQISVGYPKPGNVCLSKIYVCWDMNLRFTVHKVKEHTTLLQINIVYTGNHIFIRTSCRHHFPNVIKYVGRCDQSPKTIIIYPSGFIAFTASRDWKDSDKWPTSAQCSVHIAHLHSAIRRHRSEMNMARCNADSEILRIIYCKGVGN